MSTEIFEAFMERVKQISFDAGLSTPSNVASATTGDDFGGYVVDGGDFVLDDGIQVIDT